MFVKIAAMIVVVIVRNVLVSHICDNTTFETGNTKIDNVGHSQDIIVIHSYVWKTPWSTEKDNN